MWTRVTSIHHLLANKAKKNKEAKIISLWSNGAAAKEYFSFWSGAQNQEHWGGIASMRSKSSATAAVAKTMTAACGEAINHNYLYWARDTRAFVIRRQWPNVEKVDSIKKEEEAVLLVVIVTEWCSLLWTPSAKRTTQKDQNTYSDCHFRCRFTCWSSGHNSMLDLRWLMISGTAIVSGAHSTVSHRQKTKHA